MRPGAKNQAVSKARAAAQELTDLADLIEKAPPESLLTVGSGWWVGGGCSVNVGDTYHLSVADARLLVAKLVAAIYCCERGGNTEHPEAEAKEHAFLDALKGGLMHALNNESIAQALVKFPRSPEPPKVT